MPEQGEVPGAGDIGDLHSELPSVGAGELNLGPLEEQVSALNCWVHTFCKQGRRGTQECLQPKEQLAVSKSVCSTLRRVSS